MKNSLFSENFKAFSGEGLLFVLFIAALLYLALTEKRRDRKLMLVWYPIYALAIFFCPLWMIYDGLREDSEILYRLLWLIPMGIVISKAMIDVIFRFSDKYRPVCFCIAIGIIVLFGKHVYSNYFITKAENKYHVPQTVVEICDKIRTEGREFGVCMPIEFIQSTRQYDAAVVLAYGREVLIDNDVKMLSNVQDYLFEDVLDTEAICTELRRAYIPYWVVKNNTEFKELPEKYGFELFDRVDEYNIYLDKEAYMGLWDEEE